MCVGVIYNHRPNNACCATYAFPLTGHLNIRRLKRNFHLIWVFFFN